MEQEHYGYALGLGLSAEARQRLAEFKPHVAHFTVCDLLGMDGVAWARKNNVALVGTWHSNYCEYVKFYSAAWWLTPVLRRYIQQFYGAIPTTYVPTDYMRGKLTVEGYDQYTDMQIWGRGIDLERFNVKRRSEQLRRRLGCRVFPDGTQDILIIWTGRLVPEKRPDIWRDVVQRLQGEGLPVKGVVVGVGPCQEMFASIPGVTVLGWLSGIDLAEAYASADILLFPSDVETFGNVTLEALGSGIPGVVEGACSRHLVSDGVEGFTVMQNIEDPNDKAAYLDCVERYLEKTRRLVTDPALRAECAANALKKAATYSNEMVQQRMIDNYKAAYTSQVTVVAPNDEDDNNDDPNDKKSILRRPGTHVCSQICLLFTRGNTMSKQIKQDIAHMFFSVLARIVIFMLWLLLGLPSVTTTNLEETNIRNSPDDVTTIEV
mmetsp:Transcript_26438/g.31246  ORF Transcript_26438/g.31246 Transcript_26438/m.31246 type:complete len:434 (+) Transcript_26438:1-1302(+)